MLLLMLFLTLTPGKADLFSVPVALPFLDFHTNGNPMVCNLLSLAPFA